jgi:hypothetical protein
VEDERTFVTVWSIDAGEDVGEDLPLDRRSDRLLPQLPLVSHAEDPQREQRAGHGCDEHPQGDRARVGQQTVAIEEIDPEPHDFSKLCQRACTERQGSRR